MENVPLFPLYTHTFAHNCVSGVHLQRNHVQKSHDKYSAFNIMPFSELLSKSRHACTLIMMSIACGMWVITAGKLWENNSFVGYVIVQFAMFLPNENIHIFCAVYVFSFGQTNIILAWINNNFENLYTQKIVHKHFKILN